MGWLWAIIVGLVLGMLAKAILPGKQHSPIWLTTIFGMIGATSIRDETAQANGKCHTCQLFFLHGLFLI